MKTNKFDYWKVIQQNYGFGFEDVSFYESDSTGYMTKENRLLLKHDLKEYLFAGAGQCSTRVIFRREPKTVNED